MKLFKYHLHKRFTSRGTWLDINDVFSPMDYFYRVLDLTHLNSWKTHLFKTWIIGILVKPSMHIQFLTHKNLELKKTYNFHVCLQKLSWFSKQMIIIMYIFDALRNTKLYQTFLDINNLFYESFLCFLDRKYKTFITKITVF